MVTIPVAPVVGPYLVVAAFASLVLAGVVFLVSFVVTPSRLETVFGSK
ncbi:hypothetical protein [Natrarchaeobius chitinivorans]|nr:hypothetical protein [Natrarchaeobius chitinivorans]